MQHKKLYGIVLVLVAAMLFVQANQSDEAANSLIEDVAIENTTLEQKNILQIDDEQQVIDLTDNEQESTLEEEKTMQEDLSNGLQPSLPGPKPEEGGIDNPSGLEQGENWERTCTEIECVHTLYPYQKYYQRNEQWQEIDESFYSTPCQQGYDICVTDNLYQVQMKSYPDTSNAMQVTFNGIDIKFTPQLVAFAANSLRQNISTVQHSPVQVINNRAYYPAGFSNNIDLQFRYLPRIFKEDIVIQTRQGLPQATLAQNRQEITFDAEFTFEVDASTQLIINNQLWDKQTTQTTPQAIEIRQGITSLYLTPPLASDARGATTSIQYTVENRQNKFYLTVKTPYTWLMNETRVYPVHIDPTIILDYTKILWDGGVSYATESDATWGRYSMGTTIGVGDTNLSPTPGYAYARADMDWDTTSIPDDAGIQDMLLYLYFEFVDPTNDDIRVYPMAGGNNFYPNTDEGNNAFYDDMGDGAQFTNKSVINNFNIFNITNASQDLQTFLSNGVNNWSIGLRAEESGDVAANASYFTSSEGTNVFRPLLIVTYSSFANEATGDSAIRQGIQNALGTNFLVYHETQLYIQNTTIQHQLGRFDEIAVSTNSAKYWNINYVTQGESFTHMNNLTSVVYVLELSNLTSTQITQRVETFIQGTV